MQPLPIALRVLLFFIGVAAFASAWRLRFIGDQFLMALFGAFMLLLALADWILWWGTV